MADVIDEYMNRVIREAENIAYSTRMLENEGIPLEPIQGPYMTPYEVIRAVLKIAPEQTQDSRKRLDLEELRDLWDSHKEAILARYPK